MSKFLDFKHVVNFVPTLKTYLKNCGLFYYFF